MIKDYNNFITIKCIEWCYMWKISLESKRIFILETGMDYNFVYSTILILFTLTCSGFHHFKL